MFQSYNAQLREASLDARNNSAIKSQLDLYNRTKLLQQGITPIEVEALNPNAQRNTAMSLLNTYAPKAAYSYLFNTTDGISNFIKYNEDFSKMLRGITNMSLDEFKEEWNYFTNVEMSKPAFKNRTRFTRPRERREYEIGADRTAVENLETEESKKRISAEKYEIKERSKNIGPKLYNTQVKIINDLQDRAKEEWNRYSNEVDVDKQDEYMKNYTRLIQLRDLIIKETNRDKFDDLVKTIENEFGNKNIKRGSGFKRPSNIKYKYPNKKTINKIYQWDWM